MVKGVEEGRRAVVGGREGMGRALGKGEGV